MKPYIDLLREIRDAGKKKQQRAVLQSTGKKPEALSLFGRQIRFDLKAGFPLVTTRKIGFRLVKEELLWFLSGSTNNDELLARGVTFWSEWAEPGTGDLGPIYGKQWRNWEGSNGRRVDQIANLVRDIRRVKDDPSASEGRRLILTAWNPPDIPLTRGPSACHTLAQFDVTDGALSCLLYQRSADMFLGVPYNIACYALLTHLLARVVGLRVNEFIHTFGDAHIYENHFEAVDEQLSRAPRALPQLRLDPSIDDIDTIESEQITITGYDPHPPLQGEVAI